MPRLHIDKINFFKSSAENIRDFARVREREVYVGTGSNRNYYLKHIWDPIGVLFRTSSSRQCSTTGVTKAVVCIILSVG